MWSFSFLLVLHLTAGLGLPLTISDPKSQASKSPDPKTLVYAHDFELGLGDPCHESCSLKRHVICQNATCICHPSYPVYIEEKKTCLKAIMLGLVCEQNLQCQYYDQNAECRRLSKDYIECTCSQDYVMRELKGLKPPKVCYPGSKMRQQDIPTFLGFGLGLSVMSALLCFVLRIFSRARFARPRRYANAAIPPPLTVSETYAAFALAAAESARSSPANPRPHVLRSAGSSRRTSYASLHHQRAGDLFRLTSASSLSNQRPSSRRPSVNSVRSYRSQSGLILPDRTDRDHYILYMIRGPAHSLTSETTTSTTCDSSSPRTPKSAEQILAVYHAVPEPNDRSPQNSHALLDLGATGGVGPSHTSSSFKTMSSEDVFQEEEEDDVETEEDEEVEEEEQKPTKEVKGAAKRDEGKHNSQQRMEEVELEERGSRESKSKSKDGGKGGGIKNGRNKKGL